MYALRFLEEFFKRYNVCSDMLDGVYRNYWHTNKDFIASGPALRGQKYVKYVVR